MSRWYEFFLVGKGTIAIFSVPFFKNSSKILILLHLLFSLFGMDCCLNCKIVSNFFEETFRFCFSVLLLNGRGSFGFYGFLLLLLWVLDQNCVLADSSLNFRKSVKIIFALVCSGKCEMFFSSNSAKPVQFNSEIILHL